MNVTGAALVVEDLAVRYGGVSAVRSVSFTVEPGQSVGLIGANGAGKTSTLRALMGLTPRASGTVRFGSRDLARVPARDMVRLGIGYVPEGRRVFAGLTVEKNLLLGAYARRWDATTRQTLGEVFTLFPVLAQMRGRLAGALSGGQQQMLAIGRALMARPALMLLDEPSMGLSPKLVEVIAETLQRLRADGIAMLLVEQNAMLTFAATGHCLVLENGEIALSGHSADLRANPRIRRLYLGLLFRVRERLKRGFQRVTTASKPGFTSSWCLGTGQWRASQAHRRALSCGIVSAGPTRPARLTGQPLPSDDSLSLLLGGHGPAWLRVATGRAAPHFPRVNVHDDDFCPADRTTGHTSPMTGGRESSWVKTPTITGDLAHDDGKALARDTRRRFFSLRFQSGMSQSWIVASMARRRDRLTFSDSGSFPFPRVMIRAGRWWLPGRYQREA